VPFGVPAIMVASASVGDPEGTRTVTSLVALLAVIGVSLVMVAVWLFRVTRPDPELLAPLEVMGERRWRRADPVSQRRLLDLVRPEGAQPLEPSPLPPDLDEAFDRGPDASGFEDLHDDGDRGDDGGRHGAPIDPGLRSPSEAGDEVPGDLTASDETTGLAAPGAPGVPAPRRHGSSVRVLPARPSSASTPTGIVRPTPDDLPAGDVDPEVLAAAIAELDAELDQRGRLAE
jgi:hypothetical protein